MVERRARSILILAEHRRQIARRADIKVPVALMTAAGISGTNADTRKTRCRVGCRAEPA